MIRTGEIRISILGMLFFSLISVSLPVGANGATVAYFPLGPLFKQYSGLGGKISVQESYRPLPPKGSVQRVEISRTIRYVRFPSRTIVSTFSYDPGSGKVVQNTSSSAFGSRVWTFRPPLLQYRLPFRKGEKWEAQDGQNRVFSRVWGKVRLKLPAGTFVAWVVRKRVTYDLIRRKSPQILYDYYVPNLGMIAEGGWADDGLWHWSRKLLSYQLGSPSKKD
ncbi:MAG: hypothetical protein ACYCTV_08575 [Leptospirales bacterium]